MIFRIFDTKAVFLGSSRLIFRGVDKRLYKLMVLVNVNVCHVTC